VPYSKFILVFSLYFITTFSGGFCQSIDKSPPRVFVTTDTLIFFDSFDTDLNGDGKPDGRTKNDYIILDITITRAGSGMRIDAGDRSKVRAIRPLIPIEPQQSYKFSWWCCTESVLRYVSPSVRSGDRTIDFETAFQGDSWDWLYHESVFTSQEDEAECRIAFRLNSGKAWIEDVKLEGFDRPLDSPGVIHECAHILARKEDSVAVWVNAPVMKIFREAGILSHRVLDDTLHGHRNKDQEPL